MLFFEQHWPFVLTKIEYIYAPLKCPSGEPLIGRLYTALKRLKNFIQTGS
ncbi:MAG: hypothetical protein ACPGJS_00950 [Flammeovirgaceae bacterium]